MDNWVIKEDGFDPERITLRGNKFLTGNGYFGIRGTLPEYEREEFPAINLAGIYDQVGDAWREPLNAPNGLYTYIKFDGQEYRLPKVKPASHSTSLDYRHGNFSFETEFDTPKGRLRIRAERFADMEEVHLAAMKYSIYTEGEGNLEIFTGIDSEVWDINGPHYDKINFSSINELYMADAVTHEAEDHVFIYEACRPEALEDINERIFTAGSRLLRHITINTRAKAEVTLHKYISIYTSKDGTDSKEKAYSLILKAVKEGYAELKARHEAAWDKLWNISEVYIEGDTAAMEALNYSLYHLHCIAPRHKDNLSIAARGLSGQTYKGAVFWDTEMFMLDFFLLTEPKVAKALLKYRINTLEGAKVKARQYGYKGAFYAWESQEGGFDACSDYNVTDVFTGRKIRTYFKDKQIHISAAVVYGIMRYIEYTGDFGLLSEGAAGVIIECALFYHELLVKKVSKDYYELTDVIGPDEYHERVNNNAYTNRMAKFTFDSAVSIIDKLSELKEDIGKQLMKEYELENLKLIFWEDSEKLYIPAPGKEGIIEQFDGYMKLEEVSLEKLRGRMLHDKEYWGGAYGIAAHTKIIKQADVVTMLNLFSMDYNSEILHKNWEYYEPRTEHGSSLSACMYAILACRCGMPDRAYPLFMKSAEADLDGKGKEWAGLVYIGGTHPASSGGAYMTAVEGFAGLRAENGKLKAEPRLPKEWNSLKFKVIFRGELYSVVITRDKAEIKKIRQ